MVDSIGYYSNRRLNIYIYNCCGAFKMRQIIIITIFILSTLSCGRGDGKIMSTDDKNCDFKFEIDEESENSYNYDSQTGNLRKLIALFKEENLYADTTFFIPKASLCELMKMFETYNISTYPNDFRPKSNIALIPSPSYHIKFTKNNQVKVIN